MPNGGSTHAICEGVRGPSRFDAPRVARWAALLGSGRDGKRESVQSIARLLRQSGLRVGGVIQIPLEHEGILEGYDALDLATGERAALARHGSQPTMCDWSFDPDVFARARAWVAPPFDVSFHEVGRLEAAGEGFWAATHVALSTPGRVVILCMRRMVAAEVVLRMPDPFAGLELPASSADTLELVGAVVSVVDRRRSGGW